MVRCQVRFLHRVGNFREVCDEFQVEHGRTTSIAPTCVQFCMGQTCRPPCRSQIKGPISINIWDSVTRLSKISIHLTLLVVAFLLGLELPGAVGKPQHTFPLPQQMPTASEAESVYTLMRPNALSLDFLSVSITATVIL